MFLDGLSTEQRTRLINVLWDSGIIGLATCDRDGRFLSGNPAFCNLVEYAEPELLRRSFREIMHPEDIEPYAEMSEDVATGEREGYRRMKARYVTKTGRVIWVVLDLQKVHMDDMFQFFVTQVSPAIELAPPKLPVQYPSVAEVARKSGLWRFTKANWQTVVFIVSALGAIVAEVIRDLRH